MISSFCSIVGNNIGETGRKRLKEPEKHRPELRITANFVDDLWLLQAYLNWVEEIQVDRDQMENAEALQSVLKGLQVAGTVEKGKNAEKELQTKIEELLDSSVDVITGK